MTDKVSQYGHIILKRLFLFAVMMSNYCKTPLPLFQFPPKFVIKFFVSPVHGSGQMSFNFN